jgi:hypothetical protein
VSQPTLVWFDSVPPAPGAKLTRLTPSEERWARLLERPARPARYRASPAYDRACYIVASRLALGPAPVRELEDAARREGVSLPTLGRARRELGVLCRREARGWVAWLPNLGLADEAQEDEP